MRLTVTQMDLTQPASPAAAPPASPAAIEEQPELVIRARRGWSPVDWRELLSHRELLFFLIWRDVKVKYKQALLGFAWAILVPLIQVLLFTGIGIAMGLDKLFAGPYIVYVYAGLLPWLFLSSSITNGGLSLMNQQNLLTKIYMPRLLIPASTIGTALVDFTISASVFTAVMAIFRYAPAASVLAVPLLILLMVVMALGIAFTLSALTINYRDVRFLIPFLAQVLMWISAAVYPPRIFQKYPTAMALLDFNPVYGVISAFRSAILGEPWHWRAVIFAAAFALASFVWGMYYFKKAERRFADIA